MIAMDEQEKRLFPRTRLSDSVLYQLNDLGEQIGSLSADISEGGLRIKVNDFIPLGREIRLQIKISSSQTIVCSGKVVWVQKERYSDRYQAGISFESPEYNFGEGREQVRKYVNRINQSSD
jgi:Tfp pilus assembly protein PilZ